MLEMGKNITDIANGIKNNEKITTFCKNYLNIISDTNFDYVEKYTWIDF